MNEQLSIVGSQTIVIPKAGLAASMDEYKFAMLYGRLVDNGLCNMQARKVCDQVFIEVMAVHALQMLQIDNNLNFKKGKQK